MRTRYTGSFKLDALISAASYWLSVRVFTCAKVSECGRRAEILSHVQYSFERNTKYSFAMISLLVTFIREMRETGQLRWQGLERDVFENSF